MPLQGATASMAQVIKGHLQGDGMRILAATTNIRCLLGTRCGA